MKYYLCLSLGHNASAVLIENGKILIGYENERFTGVKSDSKFPSEAIGEIGRYYDLHNVRTVFVSHWETFGDIDAMSYKHWRRDLIKLFCPNANIRSHYPGFSHHDAHVEALRVFSKPERFEYEIVADGFGNFNEVISIYRDKQLIHRVFGMEKSLGLLYQYTTAYLDLKMNQDEYKLLGYEAHITEVCDRDKIDQIQKAAKVLADKYVKRILEPTIEPEFDQVAGLESLPKIRMKIRDYNDYVLYTKLGFKKSELSLYNKRVIMAHFIQSVVENVMVRIVLAFNMKSVALTGGLFMNVKLNNAMLKFVYKMCVMPICGDVSGGLGVYNKFRKDLQWPEHLFWGRRDLQEIPKSIRKLLTVVSLREAISHVDRALQHNKIVNLVYGNMEYGARALGHTSTIALPTMDNVEYINHLNNRSTEMPMAPFVSSHFISHYEEFSKVYKSLEYMIITLDFKKRLFSQDIFEQIRGAMHNVPNTACFTSRPQLVVYPGPLTNLVNKYDILINTSFNRHGVPIVCTIDQVLETHAFQLERDNEDRMLTIVVTGE